MTAEGRYELHWPKDGLYVDCFVHEILNYRFHWHEEQYELNILLNGSQEFCRGKEPVTLEAGDVLVISPGVGHASFGQKPNTRALVLHFPTSVFKRFVKRGNWLNLDACCSTPETRGEVRFAKIRRYAAEAYMAAAKGGPYATLAVRGSLELLLYVMCTEFEHPAEQHGIPEREDQLELTRRLISYIDEHYAEKLTLEDLAEYSRYNRTYFSTLFKNTVGVNFHEYLTRVRFQHTLVDLALTQKSLTEIALNNGFSDLKSLNAKYREILNRTPAEYRAQLTADRVCPLNEVGDTARRYISWGSDDIVQAKLKEYAGC
jgi:AraC-like DNA-binding protein